MSAKTRVPKSPVPGPARPGPASYTEQTWTSGRRSGSAASPGSGFRCCLRHLRASLRPRRPAVEAALPAPASRGKRESRRCRGRRSMRIWILTTLSLSVPGPKLTSMLCIRIVQRIYVPYPIGSCSNSAALFLILTLWRRGRS